MPELPEVETIKNAVQKALKQAVILEVCVNNPHLRETVPADFSLQLKNKKIIGYRRIAKYIVIDLENNISLLLHLGMSGRIKLSENLPVIEKHDHIVFKTSEGYMIYNDARRFGLCTLCETDKIQKHHLLQKTGIDPFCPDLNGSYLYERLKNKNISIKQALLDQHIICGIGNIYASEALFASAVLPTRSAKSLTKKECSVLVEQIKNTLNQAIAAGGSTLKDYHKPDGSIGYFQQMHCVYNKEGKPCPNCTCNIEKTKGIQKIIQGGRSTYFCATKQR